MNKNSIYLISYFSFDLLSKELIDNFFSFVYNEEISYFNNLLEINKELSFELSSFLKGKTAENKETHKKLVLNRLTESTFKNKLFLYKPDSFFIYSEEEGEIIFIHIHKTCKYGFTKEDVNFIHNFYKGGGKTYMLIFTIFGVSRQNNETILNLICRALYKKYLEDDMGFSFFIYLDCLFSNKDFIYYIEKFNFITVVIDLKEVNLVFDKEEKKEYLRFKECFMFFYDRYIIEFNKLKSEIQNNYFIA